MTLEQLNAHFELVVKLQTAEEMLERLESSVAGSEASKANRRERELQAAELEAMRFRVGRMRQKAQESAAPVIEWVNGIEKANVWKIFYNRFVLGKPWKEVADAVGEYTSVSAVQHICSRYLKSTQQTETGEH